jgi:hypothetical protein
VDRQSRAGGVLVPPAKLECLEMTRTVKFWKVWLGGPLCSADSGGRIVAGLEAAALRDELRNRVGVACSSGRILPSRCRRRLAHCSFGGTQRPERAVRPAAATAVKWGILVTMIVFLTTLDDWPADVLAVGPFVLGNLLNARTFDGAPLRSMRPTHEEGSARFGE